MNLKIMSSNVNVITSIATGAMAELLRHLIGIKIDQVFFGWLQD